MELRVKVVAFRDAPESLKEQVVGKLEDDFPRIVFRFVEDNPDVICFASGGSEREALLSIKPGRFCLFLASEQDNAYAAATEVKAWADNHKMSSVIVSMQRAREKNILEDLARVAGARKQLKGQKAALVGEVSHWLVASAFPLSLARERFGIDIIHLSWDQLPDYLSFKPDAELLKAFQGYNPENLENEARIHAFLKNIIEEHELNGITLECFNMVKERDVTACLSLALINSLGIVAACEGDLVSLTGMMLLKAITGTIPWMANLASVQNDTLLFAHCTAPLNQLTGVSVPTHFETGKSAALQGYVNMDEVTVFRLNTSLNKAFIADGRIISKPVHNYACRTQAEIALSSEAHQFLRDCPLGNHHLIVPGKHKDSLSLQCQYLGISCHQQKLSLY